MSESAPEITSGNGEPPSNGNGNGSPVVAQDVDSDRLAQPVDLEQPPRLPFTVVGIGASAGGLEAYSEFLQHTRPDSGIAFVLVQHLSPKHTSLMAELLSKHTQMPVRQVEDGTLVQPNHVYVIRPGYTMTIKDGVLHLGESAVEPMHRRPVDDFFRSLAEEQRERSICVILSGTGSNGTLGAESIKAVGGISIAQDPDSAKFPSMPRSLIDSNLADAILRPAEMFDAIVQYASHSYSTGQEQSPHAIAMRERHALNEIIAVLRARRRHDFSVYKKPTLVRRVQRRMSLMQVNGMADYVKSLRQNPGEVNALSDDLMIHVTGFFRDSDVWISLEERVIKPMVAEKSDGGTIRCWVTACSSGEEAYTIGMLLLEAAEAAGKHFDIKIFATDTAERSLTQARAGLYPGGIESEIPPARLARFFEKDDAFYRIKKDLREMVVFAPQNVLQDPPFSRLDLITCRNLLIYIEGEAQRRVLSLLHFGLREGGTLLLGTSETITGAEDLFEPLDKRHRIYRRVGPTRHGAISFPVPDISLSARARAQLAGPGAADEPRNLPRATVAQLANQSLLESHTPAAVVVDRSAQIVYFHGRTELFLVQPRGEPTRDLLLLAREEVRATIRSALNHAITEGEATRNRDGLIGEGDERRRVEVTAAPLGGPGNPPYYLVSFEIHPEPPITAVLGREGDASVMAEELRRVRDELQSTIEELQTSNEEMKASHEEVTSINEELQSTNEELETSKEELQSLNEELTTVNAQLQAKMDELERTTNDLSSLLGSNEIAVIFLDIHLRIRRYTSSARQLIELIAGDVGRPLTDLSPKFADPDLVSDATAVLERLVPIEREVASHDGKNIYARRILPYRTADNRIDGVVLTFVDVTLRKRAEQELERAKTYAENITQTLHEPLLVLGADLIVQGANTAFYRHFHVSAERTIGRKIYDLGNGQWNIPALGKLLEEVLPEKKVFDDYQVSHRFEDIGERVMLLNARQIDESQLILLGIRDITERHRAEQAARGTEERMQKMINIPGAGVMIFDSGGTLIDANEAFLSVTGYSREEIASRSLTWRTLTPPEFLGVSEQQLARLQKTGRIGPYEKECFRKDGSRAWMLFVGASAGDGTIVECCVEVTDRKRDEIAIRESEATFRGFFENNGVGIAQSDVVDGKLLLVNAKLCKIVGYSAEELRQMTLLDLMHPDDRATNWAGYSAAVRKDKPHYRVEKRLIRKDGSVVWVRINAGIIHDESGQPVRTAAVIEDISDRKRAEQTLRASKAAAEEANRIKDDFLATLSHELRTPLGAILLWAKLMQSGAITDVNQIRDGLNVIRTSAEAQKELIEDLLDMSRITTGNLRLRVREIELLPMMRDALDAIEPTATAKDVTVSADLDAAADLVRVDPDRLRQILWNLLTNAVKFTPSGGRIDVQLHRIEDQIEIRVKDTGQGISAEFLPHVFERFRQADASQARAAGGMGLGLTIVKQLVELHGGTISAESAGPAQGATFTVRLPQPKAASRSAKRLPRSSSRAKGNPGAVNLNGRRILLVEDDARTRAGVVLLLRRAGAQVLEADSADPAMTLLEQARPDLIISDIGLPGEDGNALIRRVRARETATGQRPLPAIALTAFARESDRQTALEAGFDHHVGKPVDPDQLLAAVAETMQSK